MYISAEHDRSCRNYHLYPHNLVQQDLDVGAADVYRKYIENGTPRLLSADDGDTAVRFRDIHVYNGSTELRESLSSCDRDVKTWLGDTTQNSNVGHLLASGQVASYRDPQCRIIFLTAASSRAALNITSTTLKRVLTFHQVMPAYVEIVDTVLGETKDDRNLAYFAFRDRVFLDGAGPGHEMFSLGRSAKHYQLAYVLKTIACVTPPTIAIESRKFSIRPAAFYHHFDTETGASLWLTTCGSTKWYNEVAKIATPSELASTSTGNAVQISARLALKIYVYNGTWALQGWYDFIDWFDAQVKKKTDLAVYRTAKDVQAKHVYSGDQLGGIQILEEKLNGAIVVVQGNIKMLKSLRAFYSDLAGQPGFVPNVVEKDVMMMFDKELRKIEDSFDIVLTRAKFQSQLIGQRKKLVLQHLQELHTAKSEAVTLSTRSIAIDAQHEAVVMRIITIVTLIYLPATFVSTFFSTDVVKYQNEVNFSREALDRWLQVTLPLTTVTFSVAGYFFYQSYLHTCEQKGKVKHSRMT